MKKSYLGLAAVLALILLGGLAPGQAQAQRHYYGGWSYHSGYGYHYCTYYYRPSISSTSYSHHYAIYYPSRPRYVYYYNPVRRYYWGRYDLEGKGDEVYSLLKEKDRKGKVNEIPETAFPKPAALPPIPGSDDGVKMLPPPKPPKE
jgi:hypothetical protein